jgi:beta-ribofuranosylaminobenzene 5'-phosphate synthase
MQTDRLFIKSTARIHTALLNESGYLARVDSSIGFHVPDPHWEIVIARDPRLSGYEHLDVELVTAIRKTIAIFYDKHGVRSGISVKGGIPLHAGLGAKTSLLLGVGRGISQLHGLNLSTVQVATLVGRGGTSGIGVWAATKTGFLWDAGRRFPDDKDLFAPSSQSSSSPPALICNLSADRFSICHFRFSERGIYGAQEKEIFARHCPLPDQQTIDALAIVAGGLVPALCDGDSLALQPHLQALQYIGLKALEWKCQSDATKRFRAYWDDINPGTALCLSSMGSTLYCLTNNPKKIRDLIESYDTKPLHFFTTESKMEIL